jgi:hypothetical protein
MKKLLLITVLVVSSLSAATVKASPIHLTAAPEAICPGSYCTFDADCYPQCGDGGGYCIRSTHKCVPY